MPDEDFEDIAMIAWRRIGNKQTKLYKLEEEPKITTTGEYYIDLPCNVDIIEAVTTDYEDGQRTSATEDYMPENTLNVEEYIEDIKFNTNHLYMSGKFIKYVEENNRLWLADNFKKVKVLYKGVMTDDDGLPYLTDKEVDAIAAFCAYTITFKRALVSRSGDVMNLAGVLKADWLKLCTQARVPEYLNQNQMDEILNVSLSWDRKRYGKSFKPIR